MLGLPKIGKECQISELVWEHPQTKIASFCVPMIFIEHVLEKGNRGI